jgi:hypothetical protein
VRNERCLEDRENLMEELKNILVKSLYIWTGGRIISHILLTFLNLWIYVLLIIMGVMSCIYHVY